MNLGKSIRNFISGNFLSHESTLTWLPFVLFVSALGLLYFANGNFAESQIRRLNKLTEELKDLRSGYVISKADLMFVSKQSEIAKSASVLGIRETIHPPKKIVIKNDK